MGTSAIVTFDAQHILTYSKHSSFRLKMASFAGIWKKESVTGIEALLTTLGHADKADKAAGVSLETTVTVDGDNWSIARKYPHRECQNSFKMGEEVEFDTFTPGKTLTCNTSFDGTTLTINSQDKDYTHVCCIEGGKLKETMTVKGVSAVRVSSK